MFFFNFLVSAPSVVKFEFLAAVVTVLGDGVPAGEGAVMVGDKGVGAEVTHAVWGCAADVGEEDVTSLVAAGILKLTPVSDPEHVTGPFV